MGIRDVAVAAGLVLLVCYLASSGGGADPWVAGSSSQAAVAGLYRLPCFFVGVTSATLAVLLAEHGRRANA